MAALQGEKSIPGFDCSSIMAAANADPEFRIAARFWTARLRLDVGDARHILRIADGRVSDFSPAAEPNGALDMTVSAPAADWDELLAPIPKPFYQDLFAAAATGRFLLVPTDVTTFAYYPALRRLIEIMRGSSQT